MPDTTRDLKEQLDKYIRALLSEGGLTNDNLKDLTTFVRKNPEFLTDSDVQAKMAELQNQLTNSPQGQQFINGLMRKRKADKVASELQPFVQSILAGNDIATSIGQIRSANSAARTLRRPNRPIPNGVSPELDAAITDARGRTTGIDSNILNALRLQNLDAYMGDLSNAKTASGGQAGIYGSLAQAAVNRRTRAGIATAPVLAQLQQQNRQRYDALLAEKLRQQNIQSGQEAALYNVDLNQYNTEASAINSLGGAGRLNLSNSIRDFGNQLPYLAGNVASRPNPFPRRQATTYPTTPSQVPMSNSSVSGGGAGIYHNRRYTPDTYELGAQHAPYLGALQNSTEAGLYGQQSYWDYIPEF
jgi:hypothetical protein